MTTTQRLRSPLSYTLVSLLLVISGLLSLPVSSQKTGTISNPLNVSGGADPWLTYYNGNYYLAATTWRSEWTMKKAPTLAGLKTAEAQRIYFETDPSRCCNMWAPEFHLLDGPNGKRWYFYYTAGQPTGNYDNQRSYVLESEGLDPMGPYTFKGRIYDPQNDGWSIDGSILQLNDSLYFLFSSWIGPKQSLFIAPMSDPWTISGPRVNISQPEYDWERNVNEGPVALQHEGKTFITYSASPCSGPDYQIGMLEYSGDDPLVKDSWIKHVDPVFARSDENSVFAPGHHGFFTSPDGTEDWIVYHANDSISGGCDGQRTTRVQKFTWSEDGTPNFGVPVALGEVMTAPSGDTGVDVALEEPTIIRFESVAFADSYLRHLNFTARIDVGVTPLADSQFRVVPSMIDIETVSIELVNFPGFFMRHVNNSIVFMPDDNSETFDADTKWTLIPGLADSRGISFQAYSKTTHVIGQMFGTVALVPITESMSNQAKEDATFYQRNGDSAD